MSRQRPPISSSCISVSLNADLLVYCSGKVRPSTNAPAGAHWRPASRPTRPPNARMARAPRTGLIAAAADSPCIQNPAATSMGRPGSPDGTTAVPCGKKPTLEKERPGCAPPKAASDSPIRSVPCWATQYPDCR